MLRLPVSIAGDQIMLLGGTPNDADHPGQCDDDRDGADHSVYGDTTIGLNGVDASEVSPDSFLLA